MGINNPKSSQTKTKKPDKLHILQKLYMAITSKAALPQYVRNLTSLLPTGTVFAFQTIIPSLSNNGKCKLAHRYMTLAAVILCSLACFLSSFTDSFVGENGKLYYGIATPKGLYVFNDDCEDDLELENNSESMQVLKKYRLRVKDFIHAGCSLTLFLVVAFSCSDVQHCFFPEPSSDGDALISNLPLAAGILAGGLFMIFPTKRRGIGYADNPDHGDRKEDKEHQKKGADKDHNNEPKSLSTQN